MVAAPVEVALEGPQHERREQRLRVAERGVAHELEAREQGQRREHPGEGAVPAAADQPAGYPVGHHASEQSAGARDHQPQVGRGVVAEERERNVVKRIGSGFQEGPPSVTRSRCAISRPHMIQAHGS